MKEINITEWVKNFTAGMYDSKDVSTQIDAGWFDWFCSQYALAAKTQFLGHKLMTILNSKKFDNDKTYVWFKNNCPVVGPLYDDFRIADLQTGDVIFTIQHLLKGSHGSAKAHWEVYGRENDFAQALVEGSWNDVKKYFLSE